MKRRSGIALMITIGFIALITGVVFASFALLQTNMNATKTVKNLAQTQLVIKDFKLLLDTITKDIKDVDALELLLDAIPPTVSSDDAKFILDIQLHSMHDRININSMFDLNASEQVIDDYYSLFLHDLLNAYHVQAPDTMIALIVDTVDKDEVALGDRTERKAVDADFSDGHISSIKTLNRLADIYASMTKDSTIYDVPWEKFFSFGVDEKRTLLDCNRFAVYDLTDVELVTIPKLLGWRFTTDADGFDYNCTGSNDPEIIKGYNIGFYDPKQDYYLHLDIQYELEGQKGAFTALYNLKDKSLREISIKPAL